MKFTKMQGLGNDYVYVNCFEETVERPEETARFVSSRNFGIGSDGLILIKPSEKADCQMDMYNLDGSPGCHVRKWDPLCRKNTPMTTESWIRRRSTWRLHPESSICL